MEHTTNVRTIRDVLPQYVELCTTDTNRLTYHLASNAVLEWNGLTIKGRGKIVNFLRTKHHDGTVQSFPNPATGVVLPFEERETHKATMTIPPENLIEEPPSPPRAEQSSTPPHQHQTPDKDSTESPVPTADLSFETPPRPHSQTDPPDPPGAPSGGRQFLPLSSSSDEEESPQSEPHAEVAPPRHNVYSELKYLEAIGTIRTALELKHRGTRTTHHIPRDDPPSDDGGGGGSSSGSTPTSARTANFSEKRTKLKLSYRTHLRTHDLQFALIIYEDLSSTRPSKVRRNLFSEEEPVTDPDRSTDDLPSPVRSRAISSSPEATPLPESPPSEPATAQVTPPHTPIEPPGTPHRQRRLPPTIPSGLRTSPRRSRAVMDFTTLTSETYASNNNNNVLQTWPRKTQAGTAGGGSPGGGSAAKNRKLASGSTTVRKPLRF